MVENTQVSQNNDWRGVARNYSTLSPETEKLLVKYLKMQIAAMVWGGIVKFLIIVIVIGTAIFSTLTLAPFLEKQLEAFQSLQPLLNNVSGVALPNSINK